MKIPLSKKLLLLGVIPLALSGCVTYPIAKNLQKQAQPLTLSQVVANPGACQGTVVIWGGRILKTVNDVNSSAIYVLKLPLNRNGRPSLYANSPGRFIASSKGFLDPEVYKSGRLVTVAGVVTGLESQPVQNTKYTYPVVTIKQIHLWPVQRRHYYYYPNGYWYGYGYYPSWYWGGWYPAWGWGWDYDGDEGGGGDWDGGYHYHDGGHWNGGGAYHYQGGSRGGGHWQGRH